MAQPQDYDWYLESGAGGEFEELPACATFGSMLSKFEGALLVPTGGYSLIVNEGGGAQTIEVLPEGGLYFLTSSPSWLDAIETALSVPAVHATFNPGTDTTPPVTGDWDLLMQAKVAGDEGNAITIEAIGDSGVGVGVTINQVGTAITIHYESGVSTITNIAAAIAADSGLLIEVVSAGSVGGLTSPDDDFEPHNMHDGADGLDGLFTLSVDDSDGGTGQITVSSSGAAFTIAFPDAGLMTAMGFTGTTGSATTHVAPRHTPHLWLPNRRIWALATPDGKLGFPIANAAIQVAPSGDSYGMGFGVRHANWFEFRYISGSKAIREFEVVPGESFEEFWNTVIAAALPVRYHLDRSDDTRYVQWLVDVAWPVRVMEDSAYYLGKGCLGKDSRWHLGPVNVVENRAGQ